MFFIPNFVPLIPKTLVYTVVCCEYYRRYMVKIIQTLEKKIYFFHHSIYYRIQQIKRLKKPITHMSVCRYLKYHMNLIRNWSTNYYYCLSFMNIYSLVNLPLFCFLLSLTPKYMYFSLLQFFVIHISQRIFCYGTHRIYHV